MHMLLLFQKGFYFIEKKFSLLKDKQYKNISAKKKKRALGRYYHKS